MQDAYCGETVYSIHRSGRGEGGRRAYYIECDPGSEFRLGKKQENGGRRQCRGWEKQQKKPMPGSWTYVV